VLKARLFEAKHLLDSKVGMVVINGIFFAAKSTFVAIKGNIVVIKQKRESV